MDDSRFLDVDPHPTERPEQRFSGYESEWVRGPGVEGDVLVKLMMSDLRREPVEQKSEFMLQ